MEKLIGLMIIVTGIFTVPAIAQTAPASARATISQRLIAAHNGERQALNLKPLIWSQALASDAQRWADKLARSGKFEHSKDADNKADHGENLWMGTRGAYTPEEMVGSWIDEKRLFKPGLFPNVSTNNIWMDVGHYTQLIWHSSSEVGCAVAANQSDEFLVCRYNPPGNWIGQNPLGRAETIKKQRVRK